MVKGELNIATIKGGHLGVHHGVCMQELHISCVDHLDIIKIAVSG